MSYPDKKLGVTSELPTNTFKKIKLVVLIKEIENFTK
jgi:hypothetical protein